MNFFGVMRKIPNPILPDRRNVSTFAPMSGAQEAILSNFLHSTGSIPGIKPLGRFGNQFANFVRPVVVDLNGDGFKDVMLSLSVGNLNEASPAIAPRFLISDGNGSLIDRTEEMIVPPLPKMFLASRYPCRRLQRRWSAGSLL